MHFRSPSYSWGNTYIIVAYNIKMMNWNNFLKVTWHTQLHTYLNHGWMILIYFIIKTIIIISQITPKQDTGFSSHVVNKLKIKLVYCIYLSPFSCSNNVHFCSKDLLLYTFSTLKLIKCQFQELTFKLNCVSIYWWEHWQCNRSCIYFL